MDTVRLHSWILRFTDNEGTDKGTDEGTDDNLQLQLPGAAAANFRNARRALLLLPSFLLSLFLSAHIFSVHPAAGCVDLPVASLPFTFLALCCILQAIPLQNIAMNELALGTSIEGEWHQAYCCVGSQTLWRDGRVRWG